MAETVEKFLFFFSFFLLPFLLLGVGLGLGGIEEGWMDDCMS